MKKLFFLFCIFAIFFTGCFGKAIEDKCAKDLKSDDVNVRIKAARKLGDVATAEAIRILLLHKDDPNYRVKDAVKEALKKIDKRTFLN
jgi:HEAT repeat protein